MTISRDDATVRNNPEQSRYEIFAGDELAGVLEYSLAGNTTAFMHTVIYSKFEGSGFAGRLVGAALDDLRTKGLQVRPDCSYVATYITKHPEYQDLVA